MGSGTMKAVRKMEPKPGAVYTEVGIPEVGPGEVLVKVKATSICGTDYHIYEWNPWAQSRIRPPQTMGHELAGEVVEVGSGVKSVKVGDYVSAETHIPCGVCYACRTDRMHICLNMKILGVDRDGAFAEYITVPEIDVWQNDSSIPPEIAAIQEPLGNAIDTVLAEDVAGKSVLVTGMGPIGLLGVGVARVSGATTIICTDVQPYRLELARGMGATHVLNPKQDDVVASVMEVTGGVGVEVLLEMSGNPAALDEGLKALVPGGRVSLLGLFGGDVTSDLNNGVIFKGARVYGITGRKMFSTWYKSRNFLASGLLDVSPVITHTFPLADFEQGVALIAKGVCGKVVLLP